MKASRKELTRRRHVRIRRRVFGTSERPRLAVFRSNQHIYAQIIDDTAHHTLVAASTVEPDVLKDESGATQDSAAVVGKLVAERALKAGITQVVFDRGGKLYHGRVAALAEAAREAGLSL
ncbi:MULTISPECIES: 50S ribosomal protein L18 [unclassified Nodosilinea]|jgi:large subunit ribosomal protein L18|uniref:Large ribosomal subunit protein uL18 n=1 Tax=Leptolyngbya subtilissima DQ-A4 TaxID=2933933 RepID=A0ABV0JXU7_9CYAN|nr:MULTISPECIES: 50S ribosomal protein L18 [unclassified Nodosilinea]MBD2109391.1 50S ribosomal protein L18 [Nodosilinea sp. FACHB-13]MBD2111945.1 50S ribosomal protein L18 [Nodosilinea sp. FACHB-141]PZV10141.1 MAG: 50S ribosomal protein L18 [Leptolyngbya sp.]